MLNYARRLRKPGLLRYDNCLAQFWCTMPKKSNQTLSGKFSGLFFNFMLDDLGIAAFEELGDSEDKTTYASYLYVNSIAPSCPRPLAACHATVR